MPSIALFFSSFTNEDEIREKLSSSINLAVVDDNTIIDHICKKGHITPNKLEHAIYKKTSVFNQFTLERERNIAYLKSSFAENMAEEQNVMYCGEEKG